jgi:hypothetical protein
MDALSWFVVHTPTVGSAETVTGLMLDVLGALFIARSFVVKRTTDTFNELRALGVWDFTVTKGASRLLLSWLVQSLEAKWGFVIITLGFFCQALGALLAPCSLGWSLFRVIVGLDGVAFILTYFALPRLIVVTAAKQSCSFYEQIGSEKIEGWDGLIAERLAELKAIERTPGDWLRGHLTPLPIDTTLTSGRDLV